MAEKLSVAKGVVEGFSDRDHERLLTLFTPDVEFATRVDVMGERTFRGHDGVRAWLEAVDDKYDRFEIADCEFDSGRGDAVFVACRLSLQFTGDRYGMSRAVYWVFRVNEEAGRVRSFTSFRDRSEALAAAGLS